MFVKEAFMLFPIYSSELLEILPVFFCSLEWHSAFVLIEPVLSAIRYGLAHVMHGGRTKYGRRNQWCMQRPFGEGPNFNMILMTMTFIVISQIRKWKACNNSFASKLFY